MVKTKLKQQSRISNILLAKTLITRLAETQGVKTFCLCPGGRNAPLITVLSKAKGLKKFSFFEERSAGFFAMGRSLRDKSPSAVVTTSGTAVAELLPSVVEAYYVNAPLILITADRPSSYRGTGAPQSIKQVGIFSHYVTKTWDLENSLNFDFSSWDRSSPCHINICFKEPLIDTLKVGTVKFKRYKKPPLFSGAGENPPALPSEKSFVKTKYHKTHPPFPPLSEQKKQIKNFFSKVSRPVCLLAELPENVRKNMEELLQYFSRPIYTEALSGLRQSPKLQPLILKSGESILNWILENKKTDGIIRFGRRPCLRFWKDLEKPGFKLPVLSVSDQAYSGLAGLPLAVSFPLFFKWMKSRSAVKKFVPTDPKVFAEDKKQSRALSKLLRLRPLSEPGLIRRLSQKIPGGSLVFLGNSLPIREWNLSAVYHPDRKLKYKGQRGANGIDGMLSHFLGLAQADRQNWCLIGDLTCLYDLSAPWVFSQMDPKIKCFIVVINNLGGQIFSTLFSDPVFLNSHNLRFKKWAEMWNFNYYYIRKWPKKLNFTSPAIIEIAPEHKKKPA